MKLFTPIQINNIWLKNRLVLAPLLTNYANDDGTLKAEQISYYEERAKGGVGLLVIEGAHVNKMRKFSPKSIGVDSDCQIPRLKELVERIHSCGAKVAIQIGENLDAEEKTVENLTIGEIEEIIDHFVNAACRVKEAGFDVVEFHLCHCYTLANFISKLANKRKDEYGSGFEGRMKIVTEIVKRSKEKVGKNYTMMCRINGDEFVVGGNTLKDSRMIAKRLEGLGIHAIDISCGGRFEDAPKSDDSDSVKMGYSDSRCVPTRAWPEAVNIGLAEGIKEVVRIPVIGGGKITNPGTAEKVLQENKTDLVYLGRALYRDPHFPKKAQEGRWDEINECISCNHCLEGLYTKPDERVECKLWNMWGDEKESRKQKTK